MTKKQAILKKKLDKAISAKHDTKYAMSVFIADAQGRAEKLPKFAAGIEKGRSIYSGMLLLFGAK